jgi:hypothetical protein
MILSTNRIGQRWGISASISLVEWIVSVFVGGIAVGVSVTGGSGSSSKCAPPGEAHA